MVLQARAWLGTRWQHQASLRGVGSDCIGLIAGVARELHIPGGAEFADDVEVRGYGREPDVAMLTKACTKYLDPIDIRVARMADIFLFRHNGEPRHFGIITKRYPDYVVHAYAQARKVVENSIDEVWRSRIVSAWRYRGVVDG